MRPLYQIVPPPRRSTADHPNSFVRQPIIERERDQAEQRRTLLAALVVCVGVGVAAFALWQARVTRTVYVPVPMERVQTARPPARLTMSSASTEVSFTAPPLAAPTPQRVIAAPALPMTQTFAPSAPMPTPVDYAARDRQVASLKARGDALDEQVRCIRDNPKDSRYWWHYSSSRFNGIDQAALDAYLKELDRQRNDLRREKWALEGR